MLRISGGITDRVFWVSTSPGETELQRIPCLPCDVAIHLVSWSIAALEVLYAACARVPCNARSDAARLSTHGRQIVLPSCNHGSIPPEAVAAAIREVVTQVRSPAAGR
jgi:hypothetical protein